MATNGVPDKEPPYDDRSDLVDWTMGLLEDFIDRRIHKDYGKQGKVSKFSMEYKMMKS